jgi:hypothetical protein
MARFELIGVVLLAVALVALVAVTGPAALGALAGAALFIGVVRVAAPKR